MRLQQVAVEVTTGWTSPEAPREIDAPMVADDPDAGAWADNLDTDARRGLHGRVLTQLLRGEPVEVVEEAGGGWARVVAPWQPAPEDARGYPAWVRRAHLEDAWSDTSAPAPVIDADREAILEHARQFSGLPYLWGGTSPYGFDCSGVVHYCYRRAGVVVPRDAHAQYLAAAPVPIGEEQPGDLYFFARPDAEVHHVGFVTGKRRMLHAPETGSGIEESTLAPERHDTLLAAGRFLA